MADKRYDAVFLGNSLTSLTAAAFLAKRGRRVFLLSNLDRTVAPLPDPAFRFSTGPLLYFGFERLGAMEGFFSELAFPIPTLRKKGLVYNKCTPLLQVIQPSHRVDLYADRDNYLDELKREYGSQVHKLKVLFEQVEREVSVFYPFLGQFQQVEISGMGERLGEWRRQLDFSKAVRTQQKALASDFLSQFSFSADLRHYFELLSLFAYKKPLSKLSAFDLILLLSGLQNGGVRMTGGYPTLVSFFHKLIKEWGGTISEGEKASGFERKGKTITELRLSHGGTVAGSQFIISKPPVNNVPDFFFRLPQDLLPPPMKETLLMTWGKDPPHGFLDILVLRLNIPDENREKNENVRRISVSVFLRERRKPLIFDHKALESKILERLYWLIPFSKTLIVPQASPLSQERFPFEAKKVFDPMRSGDSRDAEVEYAGKKKELIKGVSYYLRPKGDKNLLILPSDHRDGVAWGSAFVAGKRLADLIETA